MLLLVEVVVGKLVLDLLFLNQPALLKQLLALDPKLEDMNIGIGKGKVWSKAIAVVVSPRAGVDSLIANTLVIDMDETDLPNALHHHYTIDRYIGSGNTGRTFPSGNTTTEDLGTAEVFPEPGTGIEEILTAGKSV